LYGVVLDKEAFLGFLLQLVRALHQDGCEFVRPEEGREGGDGRTIIFVKLEADVVVL